MNRHRLKERLAELDLEDQCDAAEAIYGDRTKQYNVSRWLSGARGVPSWVPRQLELYEIARNGGAHVGPSNGGTGGGEGGGE